MDQNPPETILENILKKKELLPSPNPPIQTYPNFMYPLNHLAHTS